MESSSFNIELPETVHAFVQEQTSSRGLANPTDYVVGLILEAQQRAAESQLETLLLEGMDSPATPMTENDWDEIRANVHAKFTARRESL